jgi:hypothetical protein
MKKAQPNKENRKLEQAYKSLHDGGTREISVANNGADDKFSIVLAATVINGTTYFVNIGNLSRDEKIVVDLRRSEMKITRAQVMWRDINGVGRYTCAVQSQDDKFFLSLLCWWIRAENDGTVEENFLSGSEQYS